MDQSLKDFDDNPKTVARHKRPSSKNDEFELPEEDYYRMIKMADMHPELDPFTNGKNSKCTNFFTKEQNAFALDWVVELPNGRIIKEDVYVNHPHTKHPEAIRKIDKEYHKLNINIMMIIPANTMRTKYWHHFIEPYRIDKIGKIDKSHYIYYFPYDRTIRFLLDGKPSKDSSRNAYMVVKWSKQIEPKVK